MPDRRLLELEDHINFLLKGPRPSPRASSTHVPQAYVEAVSSNPHSRNLDEPPRQNSFTFCERVHPNPQPQALRTHFKARVIIREEARHPVAKNVNSISLIRGEEEKSAKDNAMSGDSIEKPDGSDTGMPLKEAEKENEAKNGTKNEPVKSAEKKLTQIKEEESVEAPDSQSVGYYMKHKINKKLVKGLIENQRFNDSLRLTDERPAETDIRLSLASHSYIYPLGIAEDVLVDVTGYVYPVDFVILDIKEDKKRPFILGTPFLTTAKAMIKFDKGTITLRSGKSNISFHKIPETLCRIEKGTKNNIEPIAPTMTVNRLVLEWEERIKLHQEKKMKFDQWRSKIFDNERLTPVKEECEVKDEGGVTNGQDYRPTPTLLKIMFSAAGDIVTPIQRDAVHNENVNPPPNHPILPATLRARFNQELQELQKFLAFVDSRLESIERFLNRFADQPNDTSINNPESDDGSVDTPLVFPFPHFDNDSYDEEVLNDFDRDDLAFECMMGFRKFTAYLDPLLPMNIISRKAYNRIMVDRLEGTGKNLVAIVRDVYVFVGSFTYITDFVVLEGI
ncbi:MAK10-like protein [Tanacetum coccineum]